MAPPKKGLQVARTLNSRNPSVGIVILLETSTRESVIAAFRCGAAGVFSRTESLSELARCIERVSRGEIGANKNHSEFLLEALRSTPSCEGIEAGKIDQLSPRELQVAEHAAQGESNKQIADRLGLSEHTVKNYLFHVFEKLGVSNRFELLFLLFKECNGAAPDRAAVTLATGAGPSDRNLFDGCRGRVRRGPIRCRTGASRGLLRRKERPFCLLLVKTGGSQLPRTRAPEPRSGRAAPQRREGASKLRMWNIAFRSQ